MIHKKILSLLVLLMTAATGAWADVDIQVKEITSDLKGKWQNDNVNIKATELPGFVPVSLDEAKAMASSLPASGTVYLFYAFDGGKTCYAVFNGGSYQRNDAANQTHNQVKMTANVYYTYNPDAAAVSTNDAEGETTFTEAEFFMPAFDATVNYDIMRDMEDEDYRVEFSGLSQKVVVKKKTDSEAYEPLTALTIQLIDDISGTDVDIIEADGITIKVLEGTESNGTITYDETNPIAYATFLADMQPGLYKIVAVPTDPATSPYTGTASLEFQTLAGYPVDVPAGEFATYYKDEPLYTEDEDAVLMTVLDCSETKTIVQIINAAPALMPLLVLNTSEETKTFILIPFTEDEEHPATQAVVYEGFKGTLEDTTVPASTNTQWNYVLNGKQFVYVKNDIPVGANRCWLEVPKNNSTARTLEIVFGDATGISKIEDGRLKIENCYDLSGRHVNKTTKGVYIVNGRKVMIK